MATATTTPKKKNAAKAAKKAEETTVVVEEAPATDGTLEKVGPYTLTNKGRTKGGEGKQLYWNLHESGVRGQIFTDPDVVEVKVLLIRNTAAVVE